MNKVAGNTLLLLGSVVLTLIAGEVMLRIVAPPAYQVKAGTVTTPKAMVYGWAYPPNYTLMSFDQDTGTVTSVFKTNSQGWKDVEHARQKPRGVFRILVLGDSYTFGLVSLQQLYTRRIEAILHERGYPNVEVITMGLPGAGVDHALVMLQHEGKSYQPDIVIYQNCENDLYPLVHGMWDVDLAKAPSMELLWPFRFKLDDQNRLIKEDLTDYFIAEINRRQVVQNSRENALEWVQNLATVNAAQRTFAIVGVWYKETLLGDVSDTARFMLPTFFGGTGGAAAGGDLMTEKRMEQIKKSYKESTATTLAKAAQVKANKNSVRLAYVNPGEDPWVWRPGEASQSDVKAWALMDGILAKMDEETRSVGGRFVVFTEDGEEGKREYFRSVGNVVAVDGVDKVMWNDRLMDLDWERGVKSLRAITGRRGIPFVRNKRVYPRFIFDNHTNVEGNEHMALDIADFLVDEALVRAPASAQ